MKLALFTTTAAVLLGAASAAPVARNTGAGIVQRDVNVLGLHFVPRDVLGLPYQAVQYAKRGDEVTFALRDDDNDHDGDHDGDLDLSQLDLGQVDGALDKRDKVIPKLINRAPQIPAEVAVKSENGKIVPYVKRQIPAEIPVKSENGRVVPYAKRQIPAEIPVKSENGKIVPYAKRQIPAEVPVKSENGKIVPYAKRQIPAEVAVKSENGKIVPYVKRQNNVIPAEVAVKSENGRIVPY